MAILKRIFGLQNEETQDTLDQIVWNSEQFDSKLEAAVLFGYFIAACQGHYSDNNCYFGGYGNNFTFFEFEQSIASYLNCVKKKINDKTIKLQVPFAKKILKTGKKILKILRKGGEKSFYLGYRGNVNFPELHDLFYELYKEFSKKNSWHGDETFKIFKNAGYVVKNRNKSFFIRLIRSQNNIKNTAKVSRDLNKILAYAGSFEEINSDVGYEVIEQVYLNIALPYERQYQPVVRGRLIEYIIKGFYSKTMQQLFQLSKKISEKYRAKNGEISMLKFRYKVAFDFLNSKFHFLNCCSGYTFQEDIKKFEQNTRQLMNFLEKYLPDDRFAATIFNIDEKLKSKNFLTDLVSLFKDIESFIPNIDSNYLQDLVNEIFIFDEYKEEIHSNTMLRKSIRKHNCEYFSSEQKCNCLQEICRFAHMYKKYSTLSDYVFIRKLGEGGFGEVFEIENQVDGSRKAIKILCFSDIVEKILFHSGHDKKIKDECYYDNILFQELQRNKNITSKYVAKVLDVSKDGFLIREYFDHTLADELEKEIRFDENTILKYAGQISEGMADALIEGIEHRDLNPNNVGIDKKGNIKIFDFGLSDFFEQHPGVSTVCGIDTRDPRHIEGKPYDSMSDVYSVGAIVYVLLTGKSPLEYSGKRNIQNSAIRKKQNTEAVEGYNSKGIKGLIQEAEKYTQNKFLLKFIEKTLAPNLNERFNDVKMLYNFVNRYQRRTEAKKLLEQPDPEIDELLQS